MLTGTLCATERALSCLLENYQTENVSALLVGLLAVFKNIRSWVKLSCLTRFHHSRSAPTIWKRTFKFKVTQVITYPEKKVRVASPICHDTEIQSRPDRLLYLRARVVIENTKRRRDYMYVRAEKTEGELRK